ncbi:hypothetical protein FACS1894166_02670 [Bacilli bacterium]|nr:hypothetical protein FACS1894166_02670 [Bacilli bacterium]
MIHKIETFIEDKKAISVNDDIVNIFNSKTNEYVLCIGEVQSGKTNAILRSLRRCYKLNYKIAIVLGGVNNSLNYQTINDIKNEFAKETSQGKASIITKDNFISFSKYGNKRMKDDVFYIVCLLKGADALKKLKEYFLDSVFSKDYDAAIFDDECDYASVQTFRDQKTISKLIKLMQENFNSVKSLSITGTPFSNIRNKAFNKYDSSMIIKHGNEYTGSEYFINHNKNTYMSIPGKDLQDILFNSLCT